MENNAKHTIQGKSEKQLVCEHETKNTTKTWNIYKKSPIPKISYIDDESDTKYTLLDNQCKKYDQQKWNMQQSL